MTEASSREICGLVARMRVVTDRKRTLQDDFDHAKSVVEEVIGKELILRHRELIRQCAAQREAIRHLAFELKVLENRTQIHLVERAE